MVARDRPGTPGPHGWQLLERLGHWHGETYRARRESDGLIATLECVTLDNAGSVRVLDALAAVCGAEHPNLLGVLSAERTPTGVAVAVPLYEGSCSLGDLLRAHRGSGKGFDRGELVGYVQMAAAGLDFLGGHLHCPHKNVNSDNLIVVERTVRLTRYGYPDAIDLGTDTTGTHQLGAQGYLPPERCRSGEATSQGDQFALAIVYVELRTGRNPLIPNRWDQRFGEELPGLVHLLPAERAVVGRAVAADPGERWPSCQAFADALV